MYTLATDCVNTAPRCVCPSETKDGWGNWIPPPRRTKARLHHTTDLKLVILVMSHTPPHLYIFNGRRIHIAGMPA